MESNSSTPGGNRDSPPLPSRPLPQTPAETPFTDAAASRSVGSEEEEEEEEALPFAGHNVELCLEAETVEHEMVCQHEQLQQPPSSDQQGLPSPPVSFETTPSLTSAPSVLPLSAGVPANTPPQQSPHISPAARASVSGGGEAAKRSSSTLVTPFSLLASVSDTVVSLVQQVPLSSSAALCRALRVIVYSTVYIGLVGSWICRNS